LGVRESPLLAVCVAGPQMCLQKGEICTDPGFDVHRALWFRLVEVKVLCCTAEADRGTRLMTLPGPDGSYIGRSSLRCEVTDMNRIGAQWTCSDWRVHGLQHWTSSFSRRSRTWGG
jgi:hypothetical protein